MKTNGMKRILCAALAALFTALWSFCAAAESSDDNAPAQDDGNAPVLLVMGDSIADAYGIWNRDEACYGRIVADTNGYVYRNLGRTGYDSDDLVRFIDCGSYWVWDAIAEEVIEERSIRDYIAEADILCICIGANDYFNQGSRTETMLLDATFGRDNSEIEAVAARYYENLCTIVDLIRSVNPDAAVIFQTVYHAWRGLGKRANDVLCRNINGMIEKYDREHPGQIHVCDVCPYMDGKPQNLADDCVHPNAQGNVAIAEALLQTLYDLGLGAETTPVVNVPGRDYHFFLLYFSDRFKGFFLMTLAMLATGNGINIFRVLKDVI